MNNNINSQSLGGLLKKYRKDAGATQKQVAECLGVHCMFVSNFENDKCRLPYKHIKKVIDIYQIPTIILLKALLKDEEEKIKSHLIKA